MHNDAMQFSDQAPDSSVRPEQMQWAPMRHTGERGEKPKYYNTAGGLLRYLHDHLDSQVYAMPDAELEWFADARDNTMLMAGNLGETLGQVAALVGYEVNLEREGPRSGGLQPYGIEELLLHASDTLMIIARMEEIAGTAEWALRDRWEQRARALGFEHVDVQENGNG